MPAMPILALAFALLAAVIHVYFFVLESLWFMRPSVHRRFGLASNEQALIVRSWAYNQGFYNLFLALGVVLAVALLGTSDEAGARAVAAFTCSSMVAAGAVLFLHNRAFLRPALIQAVPPLIALGALLLAEG